MTARVPRGNTRRAPVPASDLTKLFEAVLRRGDSETITVRELLGGLETSAFGIPLAALAVPEIIPVPVPGVSLVIAIPTAMIGAQMVTARERVWLPASLLDAEPWAALRSSAFTRHVAGRVWDEPVTLWRSGRLLATWRLHHLGGDRVRLSHGLLRDPAALAFAAAFLDRSGRRRPWTDARPGSASST